MATEKIEVVNAAGHKMKVSRKLAQAMGLKEKPKVLPKPPELEVIKPIVKVEPVQVEPVEATHVEPVKVNPVQVDPEPTWEEIKETKPTRRTPSRRKK